MYYTLVIKGLRGKTPPVPVCEFISSEHTINCLTNWLRTYATAIKRKTLKTVFKIETDFSWALLQAAKSAFNNNIGIHENLDITFEQNQIKSAVNKIAVVHLCSAHIIKP